MGDGTGIEWTDATWNPVTGCDKVSAGCDHCYAETIAHRFAGGKAYPNGFAVTLRPERLDQPIRWKRPRRVFVNSMSDLFHDEIPDSYIAEVFAVMAVARQHTFQILTKRHARMRSLLSSSDFQADVEHRALDQYGSLHSDYPLKNVWLGISAEDQKWADIRIPALLETPAAVRFVSAEPLLGPINMWHSYCPEHDFPGGMCTFSCPQRRRLDWVIVGGESGRGARPMQVDWVRAIRDQCVENKVAFLLKQWGEYGIQGWRVGELDGPMVRMGKKNAGRQLDGRTWDEYPT
jgi:protein gp37